MTRKKDGKKEIVKEGIHEKEIDGGKKIDN